MPKNAPRCKGWDRKGIQCGRTTNDPSGLCQIHSKQQAGQATQFQPTINDPMEILQRLLHSPDESIRLRAAEKYLDRLDKEMDGCPRCAASAKRNASRADAALRLTDVQRLEVQEHIACINELFALAATQPNWEDMKRMNAQPFDGPNWKTGGGDSRGPVPPQNVVKEVPKVEEPPEPYCLDPKYFDAVGLSRMENGVLAHAAGDDVRDQLLDGRIPLEEGIRQERLVKKRLGLL